MSKFVFHSTNTSFVHALMNYEQNYNRYGEDITNDNIKTFDDEYFDDESVFKENEDFGSPYFLSNLFFNNDCPYATM